MKLTFLAAVFLTLLSTMDSQAQRCGDDLWINVRDADSKIIQPRAFDSVKVSVNDQPETTLGEADLIEVKPAAVRGGSEFCINRPSKWKAAAAKQT